MNATQAEQRERRQGHSQVPVQDDVGVRHIQRYRDVSDEPGQEGQHTRKHASDQEAGGELCQREESGPNFGRALRSAQAPPGKEIFLALMDAQDHDMPVAQSRKAIAERFGVTESQLRLIEREGLDRNWLES